MEENGKGNLAARGLYIIGNTYAFHHKEKNIETYKGESDTSGKYD